MRWHKKMSHIPFSRDRLIDIDGADPTGLGHEKKDGIMADDAGCGADDESNVQAVWIDETVREVESGAFSEKGQVKHGNMVGFVC